MKNLALILSLLVNVALGILFVRSRTATPDVASATKPQPAALSPALSTTPIETATSPAPDSVTMAKWNPDDIGTFLRGLKETGVPVSAIYQLGTVLVRERHRAESAAVRFPPGRPRWSVKVSPLTPEQHAQLEELRHQGMEELKRYLGDDYDAARIATFEAKSTVLPPAKDALLQDIQRSYIDVQQRLGRSANPEEQLAHKEELDRTLQANLTPTELEQYEMYETQSAFQLQVRLMGLEMDDPTYEKIYRAVTAIAQEKPGATDSKETKLLKESEAITKAVGPELMAKLAMLRNPTFIEIGEIYLSAGATPALLVRRYQDWLRYTGAVADVVQGPGPSDAKLLPLVKKAYTSFTTGLSPAQKARFNETTTGSYMLSQLAKP